MLLWMTVALLIISVGVAGLHQDAQVRTHGVARPAVVVESRPERSARVLTLRYRFGRDTLLTQYTEYHRHRILELRPGDSLVVRFSLDAPHEVQVDTR